MARVICESDWVDNDRTRIRTETELEVFNEFVRDLCLVGLAAKLGEG